MSARVEPHAETNAIPWIRYGVEAGIVGALAVVAVLTVWDLAMGRFLYTPSALGTALFTGELLGSGAVAHPGVIIGYSLIHGGLFVGGGVLSGALVQGFTHRQQPSIGLGLLLAALLFVTIEVAFAVFTGVFLVPGLRAALGAGAVGFANVCAAVGMSAFFMLRRHADDQ